MPRYDVYATRFDSLGVIDELVPARGLSFSMPLSDHGECRFSATVESGGAFWRSAMAMPFSGVLVARDNQPVWEGWLINERQSGPRSFEFTAKEWGWFFDDKVRAGARTWVAQNDHQIFRDLVVAAQAVPGQDLKIELGSTLGAATSDLTINAWDTITVGEATAQLANAAGGPEWYYQSTGTLEAPRRVLQLGDRLGHVTPQAVLEYVEDTLPRRAPSPPPTVVLLGNLYPGQPPVVPIRRRGGNVIATGRTRSVGDAATVAVAMGSGQEAARRVATSTATNLLARGWPRMTEFQDYSDVTRQSTLQRHADADLAANAGIATGYSLVTLDGDPTADWSQTPRGSSVRVVLDTDVYGGDRPVGGVNGFVARCVDTVVRVPDDGPAQVEWQTVDVQEVST